MLKPNRRKDVRRGDSNTYKRGEELGSSTQKVKVSLYEKPLKKKPKGEDKDSTIGIIAKPKAQGYSHGLL